jgi:phosphate transport system protein
MFKQIFDVWKKENLLKQALSKTEKMFMLVSNNFDIATSQLIGRLNAKQDIYETDRQINEHEREVRRKVLEHLSINPKQDLSSSLILITVVKDLERMGDYIKNIFELSYHYSKPLPQNLYSEVLIDLTGQMSKVLKDSLTVFNKANKEKAKEFYKFYRKVTEKMDHLIEALLEEKEITVREAVVYALFARYLKRIAAHLANVLTTVINPFHQVGYGYDEFKDEEIE